VKPSGYELLGDRKPGKNGVNKFQRGSKGREILAQKVDGNPGGRNVALTEKKRGVPKSRLIKESNHQLSLQFLGI